MPNYIPHYTKKKQILARKEDNLQRLIERGADRQKLLAAVEDVRDARVRVLRSRRATIPPKDDAVKLFAEIDDRIQSLLETSPEAILHQFGYSAEAQQREVL